MLQGMIARCYVQQVLGYEDIMSSLNQYIRCMFCDAYTGTLIEQLQFVSFMNRFISDVSGWAGFLYTNNVIKLYLFVLATKNLMHEL